MQRSVIVETCYGEYEEAPSAYFLDARQKIAAQYQEKNFTCRTCEEPLILIDGRFVHRGFTKCTSNLLVWYKRKSNSPLYIVANVVATIVICAMLYAILFFSQMLDFDDKLL
jgi:hypothetical protein